MAKNVSWWKIIENIFNRNNGNEETTEQETTEAATEATTKPEETSTAVKDTEKETTIESEVEAIKNLSVYVDGDTYRYGITKEGKEIIAFHDNEGKYIDALTGAGEYVIRDTSFWKYISYPTGISKYEVSQKDGNDVVTVYYNTTNRTAVSSTTYTFYGNHINIVADIDKIENTASVGSSYFQRNFINGYTGYDLRENTSWVFPENGDFPYKEFDSIVSINSIDKNHKIYTFFRGENANTCKYFDDYSPEHLPLIINDNKLTSYELTYNLVFENVEDGRDSDYLALFESTGSDVAAGITPYTESIGNSSIFNNPDIKLNINLTNLLKKSAKYELEYKVYDYYINIYNDIKTAGSISEGAEKNYTVEMNNLKSGIYYLDMLVKTESGEYHELYPFSYLPKYTYRYNETSPFGISGIRFGNYQQNDTTIELMKNLCMANVRVGISKPEYVNDTYNLLAECLEKLNLNGTRITGQYLLMNDWSFSNDPDKFQAEIENALDKVGLFLNDVEVGNETNLYPAYNSVSEAMTHYINYEFKPGYNAIVNKYHLPIVSSGVYLSQTSWFEQMYTSGIWNKTDILSTHAYSFPHSPDHVPAPSIEHSFESALARTRNFLDNAGTKEWYVSELGYPTTPGNSENMFSGVDLRTQADYTVREFILALAYGADVVESYGFYDQVNMQKGTKTYDCEYHYGMFYDQDYFGRVMPKPLAVAYGRMTRQLESVKECYGVKTSSDTIRAFNLVLDNSDENNYIVWSNCKLLSNDAVNGKRNPNLPWNNQWEDTEDLVLYASSTVTVTDIMGNATTYTPDRNGTVTIAVNGSPVMISGNIYGAK